MKSEFVKREKDDVTFTMAFSGEEFDAATNEAFKAERGKFNIDGFRKGKAPRSIIEKWYGASVFFEEAIDTMLNDSYPKALDELGIEAVDRPNVAFGEEKFEKGKGFTVTVTVAVEPEPEVKGYKGVKCNRLTRPVTEEQLDNAMESMRKRNGRMVNKEDLPAEFGDTLTLDYSGFVGDNQFEGGTAENQTLKLGSETFIPGFEDQLVGVKAGESRDVNVTFPAEYHEESLAGKDAVFHCTVHEIKFEELPELNDEFAKDVSEFDTLEELRADQKRQLEDVAKKNAEYYGQNAALEALEKANPFDVPEAMIQDEIDNILQNFSQQLAYQGMKLEDYCKYLGKEMADVRKDFRDEALHSVKTRLIVKSVAKAENIEATDEDVNARYEELAKEYNMEVSKIKDALLTDNNLKYVKADIVIKKALDFIYNNADFNDITEEPKAEAEAPAEE